MDDNNNVRPGPKRRASDPSLEDMLRRARDARLGDTRDLPSLDWPMQANLHPATTPSAPRPLFGSWALLLVGVLLGMLLSYGVVQWSRPPRDDALQSPSTTATLSPVAAPPTATPVPTDTPSPTPTDAPTAPTSTVPLPPSVEEIVSLARDFYDRWPPHVGTHMLVDSAIVQVQSQDNVHITACIAFDVATVATPYTQVGQDTRLFTLVPTIDGTWQVTGMYYSGSCSLS